MSKRRKPLDPLTVYGENRYRERITRRIKVAWNDQCFRDEILRLTYRGRNYEDSMYLTAKDALELGVWLIAAVQGAGLPTSTLTLRSNHGPLQLLW